MKQALMALALMAAAIGSHADTDTPISVPSGTQPLSTAPPLPTLRSGTPSPYGAPVSVPSAAGQISPQRITVPSVTVNPTPRPAFTSSCDGTGCWSSDGTHYNSSGGVLLSPSGKACQSVAGVMQCP